MRTNFRTATPKTTNHAGATVPVASSIIELRRAACTALMFEDTYYEDGVSIADRIARLVASISDTNAIAEVAIKARTEMNLRHVPLVIAREMARNPQHRHMVKDVLGKILLRADEPAEFLALYWKNGREPLAASVKKGLALAVAKFGAESLAKYNGDNKSVRQRDVLFMVHPKPERNLLPDEQTTISPAVDKGNYKRGKTVRNSAVYPKLIDGTLESPDTWEVELSRNDGVAKVDKWTRLLNENKLGALALLRNLRNLLEAGVDTSLVNAALVKMDVSRVLPFRFVPADHASGGQFRHLLDHKMSESIVQSGVKLSGKTAVLVDVSGSMKSTLSARSDMERMDAAAALAVIAAQMGTVDVYSFSDGLVRVPNVAGLESIMRINRSQGNSSTYLARSLRNLPRGYDRIIIVTDEQAQDAAEMRTPDARGYIINVAPHRTGINHRAWVTISGFSEAVLRFIAEYESIG